MRVARCIGLVETIRLWKLLQQELSRCKLWCWFAFKKKYYLIKYPNNGIAETGNFFNRHCVTANSGVGSLPQKRTLYWIILEIWNYGIGRTGRKRTSYCQEESQTLGTKGVQNSLCISKILN
jgi:hypothetical protein